LDVGMATPILVDSVGFYDKTWRDRLKMDRAEAICYKESGQALGWLAIFDYAKEINC